MTESCEQELRGCPFCGISMKTHDEDAKTTRHPINDCFLSDREFFIKIWNHRTIDAEAVKRAAGEIVKECYGCAFDEEEITEIITRHLTGNTSNKQQTT